MKTPLLSQLLHFADYGGLPLKIIWKVLTAIMIVVLGSGIYHWLPKPGTEWRAGSPQPAAECMWPLPSLPVQRARIG